MQTYRLVPAISNPGAEESDFSSIAPLEDVANVPSARARAALDSLRRETSTPKLATMTSGSGAGTPAEPLECYWAGEGGKCPETRNLREVFRSQRGWFFLGDLGVE